MNIVVTGSIAYDYLMTFPGLFTDYILPDQLDRISLSFLVDNMRRQRGGCAANIAYNLALLGEHPQVMAMAGQDFGEYRQWLEQHGVDTSLIREETDLFTASFFVNTDLGGHQIASFYTGAMACARELSFHDLETDEIDLAVISPNDPQAMVKYTAECQELDIPYLYDPSQQIVRLTAEDLREGLEWCDLLVVNDYEFELLREKTGLSAQAIQHTPARACVVTLGAEGSLIWAQGDVYDIPAVLPQQGNDPTGVGDAFRAGLIKGLALGLSWDLTGRMAALAATYALEQPGSQNHHYTLAGFVTRFRENFDDNRALDVLLNHE
jgi:adenosine kinase